MAEYTHGADGEGGQTIECLAIYLNCEEGQKQWAGTLTAIVRRGGNQINQPYTGQRQRISTYSSCSPEEGRIDKRNEDGGSDYVQIKHRR